ncbi:MAG: TSUP family transporter, partial [Chthoniobacterales bacterium]
MPDAMEWTLLFGAIVGLSLGLTGGGGSIFAVPLLVYGLSMDFRRAVALSLAVVGLTALYGAVVQARQGRVLWGAGIVLGIGGVLSAP